METMPSPETSERARLDEANQKQVPWKKWGPYLSERQWGTVREDYSADGNAWDYFSHDQARSRAYRRGEDGIAGFSDDKQRLCLALALWNGNDPILKERLFGLTNSEGNHGEDVKEYYYYLDSTPTHSYMRQLYKYPQAAYPYEDLVKTNRKRSRTEPEYELIDTGVFEDDRYFDVFVEFAKATPEDILIRITAFNRGDRPAVLHLLPTLWFRNTWSWKSDVTAPRPAMHVIDSPRGHRTIVAAHEILGPRWLYCEGDPELLFTENETNNQRIFRSENVSPYVKDGINDYIVHGKTDAVNSAHTGTKAAVHYKLEVPAGKEVIVKLRLRDAAASQPFGEEFDSLLRNRKREADDFYHQALPDSASPDEQLVMRQAMAGMLWSKQYYHFNLHDYLAERGTDPLRSNKNGVRNYDWFHMVNDHVISMPDKWEYPWYAAWDLAFHTIPLAMVDLDFAKNQLDLMVGELYMHPNGQIPAYEWNFGDVNPPVHAWAALYLYRMEQARRGEGDRTFLKRVFRKLMLNFTWWVNRKDRAGRNVFEGGFLGLDNIGVFDRSAPLPTGGYLEQADGTAWMALFCQNMFEIAVELAVYDESYDDLTIKFVEHFFWIANALNRVGNDGMWDEEDGFYYDILRMPDGTSRRLKVRSLVGLLPIASATVIEPWQWARVPRTIAHMTERLNAMPHLREGVHPVGVKYRGCHDRTMSAIVNGERLRRILTRMLDENEFLSPYGLRSVSRCHLEHPYSITVEGREYRVNYLPAESDTAMFGGNSNWRGPIWFPMNMLILRALLQYYLYYGDNFRIECPTGSGHMMNLFEVAQEITRRLGRIFLRDKDGRRAVFGGCDKFQADPNWRDYMPFYEYFHGDNGAGIGASHQTGWTGLVARLLDLLVTLDGKKVLDVGRSAAFAAPPSPHVSVQIGDLASRPQPQQNP